MITNSTTLGKTKEDFMFLSNTKVYDAPNSFNNYEYKQTTNTCSLYATMTAATALTRYIFTKTERDTIKDMALDR
jgi:hypothetical protein